MHTIDASNIEQVTIDGIPANEFTDAVRNHPDVRSLDFQTALRESIATQLKAKDDIIAEREKFITDKKAEWEKTAAKVTEDHAAEMAKLREDHAAAIAALNVQIAAANTDRDTKVAAAEQRAAEAESALAAKVAKQSTLAVVAETEFKGVLAARQNSRQAEDAALERLKAVVIEARKSDAELDAQRLAAEIERLQTELIAKQEAALKPA